MAAARNAVVALSVRSLRACSAGPLDRVTSLGKGTPLPAQRALPANRQRTLKAYEFIKQPTRLALIAIALLGLVACNGGKIRGDGPPSAGSTRIPDLPGDAIPRREPRSRYGNGPVYEVLGKRYTVMPGNSGYQERGVASWYGKQFHGNLTSNRETYDMSQMTAAHKTVQFPSYARGRNLRNDKSVVVRVNDRGPFVHNRIIDLSYSAAIKLDMVRDGTSLVEVTAISFDSPGGDRPTRETSPPPPATRPTPATVSRTNQIFVQVGAFGERTNAERRLGMLASSGINNAFIHKDLSQSPALLRVRIGPVADVIQYDILVEELETVGIMDPYLIVE
ncbi:MAG: septal ring lytic transglycosylase RlpA family protein [Gammaproteobacteria bacterium]|nr:septal ring lytic transglycosylase RlpA family protein [Gammaproteobacteria bacterium]